MVFTFEFNLCLYKSKGCVHKEQEELILVDPIRDVTIKLKSFHT